MRFIRNSLCLSSALIALSAVMSQSPAAPSVTDQAQQRVVAYLARLADLHCSEFVVQEKLTPNGHVEASDRARYDYLVMIDGNGDDFQLNESRIEASGAKHKPLPFLVTNGFSTMLLLFHPYYRDSFLFEPEPEELVDGKPALPVRFTQIEGRRALAALALRGREYPLELAGTVWLDKQSGQVEKIDAGLQRDMSDIGLRSLSVHVEYKTFDLGKTAGDMILPAEAVVDVTTPRQHWRNTHTFDGYKTFSTEAEQDPNVKVHADKPGTAGDALEQQHPDKKEKP